MKSIKADTTCVFMSKRYDNMEKALDEFWDEYQRNMENMVCNTKIRDRLNLFLQDASTREKVQGLLVTHDEFMKELKSKFDEC